MHIVFIVNSIYESGGLERVIAERTKLLIDQYDYNISIVSLELEKKKKFYDFHPKINFHEVKDDSNISWLNKRKKIIECLKKIEPDIITVCDDGLKGLFFPFFYGFFRNVIYERHASKSIFFKKDSIINTLKFWFISLLADLGSILYNKVVVLTESNKKEWRFANTTVIPNFISNFPENKSNLNIKRVMAVGGHSYSKGFDRLLLIWKEVIVNNPEWELHIFGRIKNQNIINLCKSLNLEKSVFFHLPTKNIMKEYLDSSIYAMTSRSEGFGMVLIEAMSCGVPCISFDCPSGPREIIKHNLDGYLIKEGDLKSYTEHLSKLINNFQLRQKMGDQSRKNVGKYRQDVVIAHWVNLYNQIA